MVIETVTVAVSGGAPESVSLKVTLEVPAAVGVPVMAPVVALRLRPAGSVPDTMVHISGATPPVLARVAEYAVPMVPEASAPVAVAIAGAGSTVTVMEAVTEAVLLDVAVMVTTVAEVTVAGAL
jgi:hypothetical protein